MALVPGTVLLNLAIRAADEVGCNRVVSLELEAPLVLSEREAVQLQVSVGALDESGARTIAIHSRSANSVERTWTRHAIGVLDDGAQAVELDPQWPPAEAVAVDLDGCYERLADLGYEYGPALRGLTALWRRGEEVFAEVLQPDPDLSQAAAFGLHPAVLDAALHALTFADIADTDQPMVPSSWTDVVLHASGATALRVRFTPSPTGSDSIALLATDPAGSPVISVGSLVLGPLPSDLSVIVAREVFHRLSRDQASMPQDLPASVRSGANRSIASPAVSDSAPLAGELRALSEVDRDRVLMELIRAEVAAVLGHSSAATVDARRSFKELGFDSVTSVALRDRLNTATNVALTPTVVYDHPTPQALAEHLLDELVGLRAPTSAEVAPARVEGDPIVIVGMSCRFPGGVTSPED
jgi:acyl transferase domain-containing protein